MESVGWQEAPQHTAHSPRPPPSRERTFYFKPFVGLNPVIPSFATVQGYLAARMAFPKANLSGVHVGLTIPPHGRNQGPLVTNTSLSKRTLLPLLTERNLQA